MAQFGLFMRTSKTLQQLFFLNICHINSIANIASSDYQNEGMACWKICGDNANSQCIYCGNKGICCKQGLKKKECDGSVGGSKQHECTKPATEGKEI